MWTILVLLLKRHFSFLLLHFYLVYFQMHVVSQTRTISTAYRRSLNVPWRNTVVPSIQINPPDSANFFLDFHHYVQSVHPSQSSYSLSDWWARRQQKLLYVTCYSAGGPSIGHIWQSNSPSSGKHQSLSDSRRMEGKSITSNSLSYRSSNATRKHLT